MTDSARKTDAKAPTSYDCSDGLLPGGIIRVRFYCLFWHKGVYMGGNDVIHNAKKTGVSRTSLNGFSRKKNICKDNAITSNDRAAVCRRARATVGRKYNFLIDNCEHFAREMHGLEKECGQFREIWECIKAVGLINAETIKTLSPKGVLMFGVLQLVFGYTDWASGQNRIASGD